MFVISHISTPLYCSHFDTCMFQTPISQAEYFETWLNISCPLGMACHGPTV